MMNHKKIISMLEDYVLERLTPAQAQEVKSHLGNCQNCRREVEELKMFGDAIHQYCEGQAEAPSMLWRERLKKGGLPPQQEIQNSTNGLARKQRLHIWDWLWPWPAKPAPAIPLGLAFLMGILANHLVFVPLTLQIPSVWAAQFVSIGERSRSTDREKEVVVRPGTEIITFRFNVPEDDHIDYRCQLVYRDSSPERTIVDRITPKSGVDEVGLSVLTSQLPEGRYRTVWSKEPMDLEDLTMEGYFKLSYENSAPSH